MIYTEQTKLAMRIAYDAHHGQIDKSGVPYVFHPYHLAEQMTDELTTCAALLHDVIEDTPVTAEQLLHAGISKEVVDAVELLTRYDENEDYFAYVRRLKNNPIAAAVKRADLIHNSDRGRLPSGKLPEKVAQRMEKYKSALEILDED